MRDAINKTVTEASPAKRWADPTEIGEVIYDIPDVQLLARGYNMESACVLAYPIGQGFLPMRVVLSNFCLHALKGGACAQHQHLELLR